MNRKVVHEKEVYLIIASGNIEKHPFVQTLQRSRLLDTNTLVFFIIIFKLTKETIVAGDRGKRMLIILGKGCASDMKP